MQVLVVYMSQLWARLIASGWVTLTIEAGVATLYKQIAGEA